MRIYIDSSALIKRVVMETESEALIESLDRHHRADDLLVSSSLAWVEVSRALRTRADQGLASIAPEVDAAMSGIAEQVVSDQVISLARRLNPHRLRSLDAMHLASALLIDADEVITYDDRLASACAENGLVNMAPQ